MTDSGKSNRLRFGEFAADLTTSEVFRHGAKVPLQDKPFQILALLLRRPKQLLARQEIIRDVWPDTFVEGDLCLNVAIRRLRSALSDDASHPRFIETVGSHGYRFIAAVHSSPVPEVEVSDRERPRVAVFPLKSFMAAQSDSLAASITELLTIQLRRMNPPFAIITPEFTAERAHKGKSTISLCHEVSADYVLVGAVLQSDGDVRVTVKLLDCRAQACLWAESYTRQGKDRFGIEEEISRNIACSVIQAIPIPLRPSHLQLVPQSAHESYLHGCCFFSKLTEVAIDRCVPLFDKAVRECPKFALAWAALANAHCALARLGIAPSRKVFPKVKSAADKALDIEDLAEARTALAYYHFLYEYDWNAAEASLVRALTIDSRHPLALGGYAQLLVVLGRPEDGVAMMRRACDLDPFSSYTRIMLGWTLYYSKNYEAASSQLKHAVELDPSLWIGHTSLGMVLERLGHLEEAIAEFRLAVEHSDNSFLAKAHLAYGLAKRGDKAGAAEILSSLLKLRQRHYFSPYWIAVVYTALDELSEALKWLAIATEERCSWIVFAREDPKFSALHADPHFRHVMDRVAVHTLEHVSPSGFSD